jgi:hypothetical protein
LAEYICKDSSVKAASNSEYRDLGFVKQDKKPFVYALSGSTGTNMLRVG